MEDSNKKQTTSFFDEPTVTIRIDMDSGEFLYDGKKMIEKADKRGIGNVFLFTKKPDGIKNLKNALKLLGGRKSQEIIVIVQDLSEEKVSDEWLTLLERSNDFCTKSNISLRVQAEGLERGIDYNRFQKAKQITDAFVQKLNTLEVEFDGAKRPLSVLEKFFVVYNFASNRVFDYGENFWGNDLCRSWAGLLTNDTAICSGFASLLKHLCDNVFTKEEVWCLEQTCEVGKKRSKGLASGHANNIVYINDSFYDIKGFTYADSCWDCKEDKQSFSTFKFCCLPFGLIEGDPNKSYSFLTDAFYPETLTRDWDEEWYECWDNDKELSKYFGIKSYKELKKLLVPKIKELALDYAKGNAEFKKKNDEFKKKVAENQTLFEKDYLNFVCSVVPSAKELKAEVKSKHKSLLRNYVQKSIMPSLPENAVKNALRAVAAFNGIQDEKVRYVEARFEERNHMHKAFKRNIDTEKTALNFAENWL